MEVVYLKRKHLLWAEKRLQGGAKTLPPGLAPDTYLSMSTAENIVAVWLLHLASTEELNAYLQETYDDDNPDLPLSPFAEDFQIPWYDHDFLESDFQASNPPITQFLKPFSYADSFGAEVAEAADKQGITNVQCMILIYDSMYSPPRSSARNNTQRRAIFLGNFLYERV